MTMLELAGRCARATGPDRFLDAEIAINVLGWSEIPSEEGDWRSFSGPDGQRVNVYRHHGYASGDRNTLPLFTASIDAAMALVLEPEKGVSVWRSPRDGGLCCATVHHGLVAEARTMPLALCAAALRARAASVDTLPKGEDREDGLRAEQG